MIFAMPEKNIWTLCLGVPQVQDLGGLQRRWSPLVQSGKAATAWRELGNQFIYYKNRTGGTG